MKMLNLTKLIFLLLVIFKPASGKAVENQIKDLEQENVDQYEGAEGTSPEPQNENPKKPSPVPEENQTPSPSLDELEEEKAEQIGEKVSKKCPKYGQGAIADEIICINNQKENLDHRKKEDHIEDGDLIIPWSVHRRRRVAIDKKWPVSANGLVYIPYTFGTSYSNVTRAFLQAVQEYNRLSCIRFVPRRSERNYVYVFSGSGCYTYAGMIGGQQRLSLQAYSGCATKGVAIHEMMHVLGFLHTMARRDRDKHITVHYQNIISGWARQFNTHPYGYAFVLGLPYDKKSVMQYGRRAAAYSGRFSITSNSDPNEELGQRFGFSPIDIRQVNRLYCPGYVQNKP